jgi:hypothetical protein
MTGLVLNNLNLQEQVVWYVFAAINAFFVICEFGFGPVSVRLVSYVKGGAKSLHGDIAALQAGASASNEVNSDLMWQLHDTLERVYFVLAALGLLLVSGLGTLAVTGPISEVKGDSSQIWTAWVAICLSVWFSILSRKYQAFIIGLGHLHTLYLWNTIFTVVTAALLVLVYYFDGGLLAIVCAGQSFHLLSCLRNRYLFRTLRSKEFSDGKRAKRGFNRDIFCFAWAPAWRGFLGIFGSAGVLQSLSLIVAAYLPAAAAAPYLLASRFMALIDLFSNAPLQARTPILNEHRVKGEIKELSSLMISLVRLTMVLMMVGGLLTYLGVTFSLSLFNFDAEFVPAGIWALMLFFNMLNRHHSIHAHIYSTTNKEPFYKPIIFTGMVNLVLALYLVETLGIVGVILASGLSNLLIMNWWCVVKSLGSLGLFPIRYFQGVLSISGGKGGYR